MVHRKNNNFNAHQERENYSGLASDNLPLSPTIRAWNSKQLDISFTTPDVMQKLPETTQEKTRPSQLIHVTHTGQGIFTKLRLRDGCLTTENMQIQRTLEQYTTKPANLPHRPPHLSRRKTTTIGSTIAPIDVI